MVERFSSDEICAQLALLNAFFREQVTGDYVYLDVPGYWNVGDHLIALGAFELLKKVPYRCKMKCTISGFKKTRIEKDTIILLHGGGNFGDLYPGANWFRNEIVRNYPDNKIIFLPQTITYKDASLIAEDALICSKHRNLHICARDIPSFEILNAHFSTNNLYLLPDTAFGLYDILPKCSGMSTNELIIQRIDFELAESWSIKGVHVKDWNDILAELRFSSLLFPLKALNKAKRITHIHYFAWLKDRYQMSVMEPFILRKIPAYFLRYGTIRTTRLHGLILATMLHIPVEWKDTKYGKLSGYLKTWFPLEYEHR